MPDALWICADKELEVSLPPDADLIDSLESQHSDLQRSSNRVKFAENVDEQDFEVKDFFLSWPG